MFFRSEDQYRRWISREITWDQAETLFRRTIAHIDDKKRPPEERYSRPKLALLMNKFDLEPRTLWGAYNGATNWASHVQTRGAVHNVERDRHNQVAKMLKSDLWARLAA
jgi:hypothetical protein